MDNYCPIPLAPLVQLRSELPFTLYVRYREKMAKAFTQGQWLDLHHVQELETKGVTQFWVQRVDRPKYVSALRVLMRSGLSDMAPTDPALIETVDALCSQSLEQVFDSHHFDQEVYEQIDEAVDALAVLAPQLPQFLKAARQKSHYTKHSMMTAVFSMLLVKALSGKDEDIKTAGISALVHDIGLSQFPGHINEFSQKLSTQDRIKLNQHPAHGVVLLNEVEAVSDEVRYAVLHHHEACDGTGYPSGLGADSISVYARCIAVCDQFASLITPHKGGFALEPHLAGHMISQNAKLDQKIVNTFNQLLKLK